MLRLFSRASVVGGVEYAENSAETVIYDGYTFVPAEFFEEFFNDVGVEGNTVTIAPSMAELCA